MSTRLAARVPDQYIRAPQEMFSGFTTACPEEGESVCARLRHSVDTIVRNDATRPKQATDRTGYIAAVRPSAAQGGRRRHCTPFTKHEHFMDETSSSPVLNAALSASSQGDSASALALLAQAVAQDPDSGIPHFLMGAEYAALGKVDDAEASFTNAVLLAPDLAVARYQLGLLQFTSGRAATALLTWQPLLVLGAGSAVVHFVTGFAALARDDFDAASQSLRHGQKLNVDNAAMNADIDKVLAEIERVRSESTQPIEEDSHVLILNYQQQGGMH